MPDSEPEAGHETLSPQCTQAPMTREELYHLVWEEPMLRIGQRLGVSSSYMARVCTDLRVPRPPRGYWAQLEFGKAMPAKPPLPPARPGDLTEWSPGITLAHAQRLTVQDAPQTRVPGNKRKPVDERHELLAGVRPHFLKTRKCEVGLLRPFKRLLVDIVTSEQQLDTALDLANELFMALEVKGHRVTFAPPDARMRRPQVDEREAPNTNHYHRSVWAPDRITVVYVTGVPIGLILFETTEEIEVVYVHGTYLPVSELSAVQLRRYEGPIHWRTKRSRASGRFCLQAFCPHGMVAWTKQWKIAGGKEMKVLVPELVRELEATAPILAKQVADAEAEAAAQRQLWEEESRRRRQEEAHAREVKLRQEAKDDLFAAIEAWDRTRGVQEWLSRVEREAQNLDEADRLHLIGQLEQARVLLGGTDALDLLRRWKPPGERR